MIAVFLGLTGGLVASVAASALLAREVRAVTGRARGLPFLLLCGVLLRLAFAAAAALALAGGLVVPALAGVGGFWVGRTAAVAGAALRRPGAS